MRARSGLLTGILFLIAASACSADADSEQEVAPLPTAEILSTLPTAVPPEGEPGQIGEWAIPFSYQMPDGTFGIGFHRYALHVDCPILAQDSLAGQWRDFVVTNDVTTAQYAGLSKVGRPEHRHTGAAECPKHPPRPAYDRSGDHHWSN